MSYNFCTLHDIWKINGLKARVGVEGFFCLVRNTPTYHIQPQWFFTCDGLEKYMKIATKKWNTHDVGTKVEAFAIAGCDPVSKYVQLLSHDLQILTYFADLLTSSKKKADHLKAEIRSKIAEMLGT